MMLWDRGQLSSAEVGPCSSWRLVPGSSPLLQDSDNGVLLCHAHGAASIQTCSPAGGHRLHLPRWRFPSTVRLAGALCRTAVLPHLQCTHSLVTSVLERVILRAPGPHGPPGRCPSPAHGAAEFTGKKQCQCLLCQVPGQQPCPCGVPWPHPMVSTSPVCREGPQETTQQHFGQQEQHLQQPHLLPAPCSWPLGGLSRVTV